LDTAAAQKRGEPTPDQRDAKLYQDWYQRLQQKKPGVSETAGVGVIANKKQAKDPRYSMSLTKDVRPGAVQKSLRAFKLAESDLGKFHKTLGQSIQDRAAKMQADLAIAQAQNPEQWQWKQGDIVFSPRTGKSYSILGTLLDPRHGAMYYYGKGEEGDDNFERGRFIANKAHETLKKLNEVKLKNKYSVKCNDQDHDCNDLDHAINKARSLLSQHAGKTAIIKQNDEPVFTWKLGSRLTPVGLNSDSALSESEEFLVLYVNGKPQAKFKDPQEASHNLENLKNKFPDRRFELKTEMLEAHIAEGLKDPKDNPCWKGYYPVGTKKKNGRTVPNCVPKPKNKG
jgi:hypothetical protein